MDIEDSMDEESPDQITTIDTKSQHSQSTDDDSERLRLLRKIIKRQFDTELEIREKQLEQIQRRISQTSKALHVLRYLAITQYYKNSEVNMPQQTQPEDDKLFDEQSCVHPAIKRILGPNLGDNSILSTRKRQRRKGVSTKEMVVQESSEEHMKPVSSQEPVPSNSANEWNPVVEKPKDGDGVGGTTDHMVRNRLAFKQRIIVGNISKWMPDQVQNNLQHKWMVYVRGPVDKPNLSDIIDEVTFYLHSSYKPNDVVTVSDYPFHLSRRGWGEFPIRVKIKFKLVNNKPVDIIHNIKLEKSFANRQTLGAETIADIVLFGVKTNVAGTSNRDSPSEEMNTVRVPNAAPSRDELIEAQIDKEVDEMMADIERARIVISYHNYAALPEDEPVEYNDVSESSQLNLKRERNCDTPPHQGKEKRSRLKGDLELVPDLPYTVNLERFSNCSYVVSHLLKKLPLSADLSSDLQYSVTFPFVANTVAEYEDWPMDKRCAAEVTRSRVILKFILTTKLPDAYKWNSKRIVLFARAYGYTPAASYKIFSNHAVIDQHLKERYTKNKIKIDENVTDSIVDVIRNEYESDIDSIVPTKKIVLQDAATKELGCFVKNASLDVGVILKEEQIAPGIFYNISQAVLIKSMQSFADDLLRCARANLVYSGNFKDNESVLRNEDVSIALRKYRHEFRKVLKFKHQH